MTQGIIGIPARFAGFRARVPVVIIVGETTGRIPACFAGFWLRPGFCKASGAPVHPAAFNVPLLARMLAALDDRQEASLIEIMVCCVKQAATGDYPIGRGPTTRRPTTKEAKVVADDKAKLTEHFIVTLPQLLAKVSFILRCCSDCQ